MGQPLVAIIPPRRSRAGMLVCALLGVFGGVVLAGLLLVFLPVPHVKALPAEVEAHRVYFVEGSNDETKAREVWAKARLFLHGGTIQVTEEELNVAAAAASVPSPEPDIFTLGQPNFRLFEDRVQVAVPVTVTLLGLEREVLVQMRGVLARDESEFTLIPHEMYVGACALHSLPGAGEWLIEHLRESAELPARVRTAWRHLRDVRVEGGILKLEAMPH